MHLSNLLPMFDSISRKDHSHERNNHFPSSHAPTFMPILILFLLLLTPVQAANPPILKWNRIPTTAGSESTGDRIRLHFAGGENAFWQLEMAVDEPRNFLPISPVLQTQDPAREYVLSMESRARFFRLQGLHPSAALYSQKNQLTSPEAIRDLSQWFDGLEFLQLHTNVLWMASYRAAHQAPLSPDTHETIIPHQLASLAGPPLQLKSPAFLDLESWVLNGTNWGQFPNPLCRPFTSNYAIVSVFQSARSSIETLVGSELPGRGPSLMAGGSISHGLSPTELFMDFTPMGTVSAPEESLSGRRTYFSSNRGLWQVVAGGFSPDNIQLQSMVEPVHSSYKSVPVAWNDNPYWTVGARLDGSAAAQRRMAFTMILDRELDPYEIGSVRRLYRKTLGRTLPFAPYNCVFEGDSFTAQSRERNHVQHLNDASPWSPYIYVANTAKGGETARQMLGQYPIQVEPISREPGRNILFLWAGANDLNVRNARVIYQDLQSYWTTAKSAGFYVVAFTIIPNGGFTGARETERLILNELIRQAGHAGTYDVLVDVAVLPELQDPNDTQYFQDDRVHLRSFAGQAIAQLILKTVQLPPPLF